MVAAKTEIQIISDRTHKSLAIPTAKLTVGIYLNVSESHAVIKNYICRSWVAHKSMQAGQYEFCIAQIKSGSLKCRSIAWLVHQTTDSMIFFSLYSSLTLLSSSWRVTITMSRRPRNSYSQPLKSFDDMPS